MRLAVLTMSAARVSNATKRNVKIRKQGHAVEKNVQENVAMVVRVQFDISAVLQKNLRPAKNVSFIFFECSRNELRI